MNTQELLAKLLAALGVEVDGDDEAALVEAATSKLAEMRGDDGKGGPANPLIPGGGKRGGKIAPMYLSLEGERRAMAREGAVLALADQNHALRVKVVEAERVAAREREDRVAARCGRRQARINALLSGVSPAARRDIVATLDVELNAPSMALGMDGSDPADALLTRLERQWLPAKK